MDKEDSFKISESNDIDFNINATNPWDDDNTNIIRNFLIKANQLGFDTARNQKTAAEAIQELNSSKIIAKQKEITLKIKSLLKIKESLRRHSEEKETAEILHVNLIEDRINIVKQICTDLDTVLQNTELIINRLQKPYVGSYIKLDAAYHRHASELFMQLVPTLNDLNVHLENITWMANNDFSPTQLEPLLMEIQSRAASLQTTYYTLTQMRRGILKFSESSDISTDINVSGDSSLLSHRKAL